MKNRLVKLFACLVFFTSLTAGYAKTIMGRVESVTLLPEKIKIHAKLDTGAFYSSIQATHIKTFKKNNKQWVSFVFQSNNTQKRLIRPYLEESKIKRRTSQTQSTLHYEKRPIVSMQFCLNHQSFYAPVSLANRHYFKYPLLMGRNLIEKLQIIVDPSQKNTHTAQC